MISHKDNPVVNRAVAAAASVQQKWQGAALHGVAHIRISPSPVQVDGDFYAVFIAGRMSPRRFTSWGEAMVFFREEAELEKAS